MIRSAKKSPPCDSRTSKVERALVFGVLILALLASSLVPAAASETAGPSIREITTNAGSYPGGQVPRYSRFEISFQVKTVAKNLQMPYDPAPPAGVEPKIGVSIDALFTPDNWQTVYRQPAFYYQNFEMAVKGDREWFYPTNNYSWRVRFAPNKPGQWQYKLVAQDAGGVSESAPQSFTVVSSKDRGFVRVSSQDPRYFEFEDGTYFPGLGYNMNYDHISWTNPLLDNETNFQKMNQNGIQLVRMWLSQWAIYGPSWNPWNSIHPEQHGQYIPASALTTDQAFPGSDVSMRISPVGKNPCMFVGFMKPRPALKPNTSYRVQVRYKLTGLSGPRLSGKPFGLVAKTGDWLWGNGNNCQDSGTGKVVSNYASNNTADWQILEGSFNSGDKNFLPNFYLTVENASAGDAFIDYVWIEEVLGNGNYGPNILPKPWMAHHLYMEQRSSYAFDRLLQMAEQYGVYLRVVLLEKEDWIFNRMDFEGRMIPSDQRCKDDDSNNDPEKCPSNKWFYGHGREMTRGRWLQQAWWRYVQARWGYSTRIHSWELLNEGDPNKTEHFVLADELGKYMRQFQPNHHLVSTSFWHSFPKDSFWANNEYKRVDFADVHQYFGTGDDTFYDTARTTYAASIKLGARQPGGAGKPVIRGEIGYTDENGGTRQFNNDKDAVWLHNLIWGGINPGGLIESYWYENSHIYASDGNGGLKFDHRVRYRPYYNFIRDIPLNNGSYQDAEAQVSNDKLLAWGQKDLQRGRAHLWITSKEFTWKKVVDGAGLPAISGKITLGGFQKGQAYTVQWWDTWQLDPGKQIRGSESVTAAADGTLTLNVKDLKRDIAVRILPQIKAPPVNAPGSLYCPFVEK